MRMMRASRIWRSPAFGFTSRMACPMMRWASWYRFAPVVVSALTMPALDERDEAALVQPGRGHRAGEGEEDAAVLGHAPLHQLEGRALLAPHVGAEGVGEQLRRLLPAGDGPGVDAPGLGVGGAQAAALGGLGHGGADYHEWLCSGAVDAEGSTGSREGGTCAVVAEWVVVLSLVCRAALAADTPPPAAPPLPVTVIRAGVLIDGVSGSPKTNQVIVIRGNRIESVGGGGVPAGREGDRPLRRRRCSRASSTRTPTSSSRARSRPRAATTCSS